MVENFRPGAENLQPGPKPSGAYTYEMNALVVCSA